VPTATRLFLSEVRNTFCQLVNGSWQQSVLVQNDYTYDNAGQRLTNQITSSDGTNRTETYTYDEINRLKSVNYGDGQTQSYTFDAMGNRTQKTDSISGTESYGYNNANMLLSRGASSYTNDLNGNTLTGGGRTNTWDSENRLYQCVSGGTTSVYTYGADGLRRRAAVTVGGNTTTTDFILDGAMPVRERRNSANYATYLVGPRGPEYRRDDVAGTVRWYLYDGLGSVLGEVDPSGNVTATRKYDVYGSVRASTGVSTSRQKFVGGLGHPSDDETGLIYMRARYCDPVTGKFVSQDPAKLGKNWFTYTGNNPANGYDFTGESTGNINEPGEAAAGEQEVEGEGGDVAFEVLKSVRNTLANLGRAK
jgi:RHS repeat-associated protein